MKKVFFFLLTLAMPSGWLRAAEAPKVYSLVPQAAQTTPGSKVAIVGEGFSQDAEVYFNGMMAREINFISESRIEILTPYLPPGDHSIHIRSGGKVVKAKVIFTALAAPVDVKIDEADRKAAHGDFSGAMEILEQIGTADPDYQVRSFARFRQGQIYFGKGYWVQWERGYSGGVIDNRAGMAIQTYWAYRLASALDHYLFYRAGDPASDLVWFAPIFKFDVTGAPEPYFYRGLLRARTGDIRNAESDSEFCLAAEPENPSYTALAAFVAAAGDDAARAGKFSARARDLLSATDPPDGRALCLLGETAYLLGNRDQAQQDWAEAARIYPQGHYIAFLAGRKHSWRGEPRIARILLAECVTMAPESEQATEARDLLGGLESASR